MTQPLHDFTELRALLDALCEETITAAQMRRLEQIILAHPEAEAFYVQYLRLHADLNLRFAGLPGAVERSLRDRAAAELAGSGHERSAPARSPRRPTAGRRRRLLLWGAVVLSGLAAALLLAVTLRPRGQGLPEVPAETADDLVAVLLQAPGAKWADTGMPTRAGAPLPPGKLRLVSGLAQIEFYSGAIVILQGPADFELISPTEAYCTRGKLRATVPPQAQGFTIRSPRADLVDRGTEFGLQVEDGGRTEVHVFQGKVEVHDAGADRAGPPRQQLTTGQGMRLDGPGASPIRTDPGAFRTAQDLAARLAEETRRRQQEWQAAGEALRRDPSLIVYYPFAAEQSWSRTLRDEANGRRKPHDGAIVGCTWVPGRWPGKQALQFKRLSDRVRLHVPGKFESLTFVAWVRVDGLPNGNNALLLPDGWKPGAAHWQIGQTGTLILGVRAPVGSPSAHYHAADVFTPDRFGQWVQLAVVYDRAGRTVTHYLDGEAVSETPTKFDIPLRIGDAELGNWNVPVRRDNSHLRYLNGCMDEFMLFARALSREEIARLYEQGRPPQ